MNQNNIITLNEQIATNAGEIILYQPDNNIQLEVRMEEDTLWLTQTQMAMLFGVDRTVIVNHIGNIFKTNELETPNMCKNCTTSTRRKQTSYTRSEILQLGHDHFGWF